MSSVTITVNLQMMELSTPPAATKIRFALLLSGAVYAVADDPIPSGATQMAHTFNDVAPGSYTKAAIGIGPGNEEVGTAITAPVTVAPTYPSPVPISFG